MEKDLTKESREALKQLYDVYTQRRAEGKEKYEAAEFAASDIEIPGFYSIRQELKRAEYLQIDVLGGVRLTDKAIIFCESLSEKKFDSWVAKGSAALSAAATIAGIVG